MSTVSKSIEKDSRLVITWAVKGLLEHTEASFWSYENVLKLTVVMVTQPWMYYTLLSFTLICVNFMVYKLYTNKVFTYISKRISSYLWPGDAHISA